MHDQPTGHQRRTDPSSSTRLEVPPERMLVVFCSECNEYLGIRDVDRMQHEHFEQSQRCRRGQYVAGVYEQKTLGSYGEALRAMEADRAG